MTAEEVAVGSLDPPPPPTSVGGPPAMPAPAPAAAATAFKWTAGKVTLSLFLFVLAGAAEIAGGWMVWQGVRLRRGWWWVAAGAVVLFIYGLIPCAQPMDNFGRVYAVYGGFFILLSYLWGWGVDGDKPDLGDWLGTGIAMVGVLLAFFWPR